MQDPLYELRGAINNFESLRRAFELFREQLDAAQEPHRLTGVDLTPISNEGPWFEVGVAGRRFRIELTDDPSSLGVGLFSSWLLRPFEAPQHIATLAIDSSGDVVGEPSSYVTSSTGAARVLARLVLPAMRTTAKSA